MQFVGWENPAYKRSQRLESPTSALLFFSGIEKPAGLYGMPSPGRTGGELRFAKKWNSARI
jgi:hypothetical protein